MAFIPVLAGGKFCARPELTSRTTSTRTCHTPRMSAQWSNDPAPPYEKYMQFIPVDRLNKAPVIVINAFLDPQYNSVSCRLADFFADEGAGDSLKAGIEIPDEKAPDSSLWSKYYDPKTVNEAPYISLFCDYVAYEKSYMSTLNAQVPLNREVAETLLGQDEPDPKLYEATYGDALNKAPAISMTYNTSDEDSTVSVEVTSLPLNTYAADVLLAKYQG